MIYIVATPIGNLADITFRAIETLKNVDNILCEDTRVTKKLLNHFDIHTPTISFHEYSDEAKYEKIYEMLKEDRNIAMVVDAGTPGISDPGYFLIQNIRKKMPEIEIVPIPGVSAITTLISVSGMNMKEFTYLGFPPHKKGRQTFFEKIRDIREDHPVVIYESTHRLVKALESIKELVPEASLVVGKELTKSFEEIITGNPEEVIEYLESNPQKQKGEFAIIIG